jgi:hypothetical protein
MSYKRSVPSSPAENARCPSGYTPTQVFALTSACDCLRETGTPHHCVRMDGTHISDHDAERYYLGMVTTEEDLAALEEHLFGCHACLDLVQETEDYVDTIQVGLLHASER